jgi:anti-anti-sigma factor
MEYKIQNIEDDECKIEMFGEFVFSDHSKFKNIIDAVKNTPAKNIIINVESLNFINASGLGMFLLLRDEAIMRSKTITFIKPQGQTKKMFYVGKFYQYFNIDESLASLPPSLTRIESVAYCLADKNQ